MLNCISNSIKNLAHVSSRLLEMNGRLPGMKLASLYSGGKDSTFSLYLAEQMGHEVPCLVSVML